MNTLLLAISSIAVSVLAQFLLKAGMSGEPVRSAIAAGFGVRTALVIATSPGVIGGFACYGAGAVLWLGVLSKWDVSKAYPLVGLGFVATVAIGYLIGEAVGLVRVIGVALICAGVWMTSRS